MENEIIMDEVIELEPVEEIATKTSGKSLVTLGVAAATVVAGYLLVKKVIVPAYKKHKAKKEAEATKHDFPVVDTDSEDVFED